MNGSEIVLRSLLAEKTEIIFGYPGGQVIPIYDALFNFRDKVRHILARHEQGAIHEAQGYARVTGRPGVCLATSGPGATNLLTGIADAMMDSTPLVCITGQVPTSLLGTDSFQEADVIGMSMPVTKWNYQITNIEEIPQIISKAFYIATNGRPGPVLIDITKDVQIATTTEFKYERCTNVRSYIPVYPTDEAQVSAAAEAINQSKKPLLLVGHGVLLSGAEKQLLEFIDKTGIPAASTLLGLSALPSNHPLNMGMLGMHGNYAPNVKTNECDLLIAVGLRFDDRVTGKVSGYAPQAKVVHIEIDPSEINKIIHSDFPVLGDAKNVLSLLTPKVEKKNLEDWLPGFKDCYDIEYEKVIKRDIHREHELSSMGEVVRMVSEKTSSNAIVVTDVGQNQMIAARYSTFSQPNSFVTSGGLGTMGFGIPAAVGAKLGQPDRTVVLFVGDGGFQMTMQELGTIMQENIDVKIVVMNNRYLGMVRQWQELFFDSRYSFTDLVSPDFVAVAKAYGIEASKVEKRCELEQGIDRMLSHKGAYLLEVTTEREDNVFPMIPAGAIVSKILFNK